MPGCGGVETTRAIRRGLEESKIVVLSLHHSKQIAEVVLQGGANAYVLKTNADCDLIDARHAALANRTYISQPLERRLARPAWLVNSLPASR